MSVSVSVVRAVAVEAPLGFTMVETAREVF